MFHRRFCLLGAALALALLGVAAGTAAEPDDSDFDTWCQALDLRAADETGLRFSPRIGLELDRTEKERYGVFGRTPDFASARLPVDEKGRFRLELTLRNNVGWFDETRRFSGASLRATRLHFYLFELNEDQPAWDAAHDDEAELIWRLALRFAARKRYELVQGLFEELAGEFPDAPAGRRAAALLDDVRSLRSDPQALVWDYPPKQGDGSNDLKLFGGYYGLWLGLAVPLAMESESAGAYGAALIAGGPVGYATASWACRRWVISEGQATMIELGGNLGTWQGLGWAAQGDGDDGSVVSAGVLTGLAGIGAGAWLSSKYEFTEGHAALTAAAAPWGAWYGLVAATLSEDEFDDGWDPHRSMMLGADLAVLGVGLAARGAEMSEKRVRLINLAGVMGSVMGLGVNLMIQPDDEDAVMSIVGIGGALGLAAGFRLTRNVDRTAEFAAAPPPGAPGAPEVASLRRFLGPHIATRPDYSDGRGVLPALSAGWVF